MWASDFLATAAGARMHGPAQQFTSISTDTRTLQSGALYVALRGENFDGHRFVGQAIKAGATGILVSQAVTVGSEITTLQVADTLIALQQMAHASRLQFDGPVIAVTGSNGKTTTKEMIAAVLRAHYGVDAVLATTGNLNNHIGVPLTLLARQTSHKVAVIEMGMNHFGEIALLTQLAEPTMAVITNAAAAHLEGVGSLAGVAEAKGEIFAGLRAGGVAVVNADDYFLPYWQVLNRERTVTTFGIATTANVVGKSGAAPGQMWLDSISNSAKLEIQLPVSGDHNVSNALAAVAVARGLGIPEATIKQGLEATVNVSGRLTSRPFVGGTTLIDDSYNANPASMRAAARVLVAHAAPRYLVLGDMGELGSTSEQLHELLVTDLSELQFDGVFTLGPKMKRVAHLFGVKGKSFDDVDPLAESLYPRLTAGATLLVKGSRSMALERVIEKLEQMSRGAH
ncbi:MAG: UDP-N-acetylmuramoyl-tripeptide--D-alanyl-D-alanine ligase [Rhizobacter sp.]|nr:UDP-N-acetylmuramoyl-tripeptide--D-alanyl-D-alanine ligase [Burkholderiales bacterium]